jgi:GNAT superfamily N-acetyltransferase
MQVRAAQESEIDKVAQIWYQGWQDAHAALMPPGLARFRTLENFTDRISQGIARVRVIGPLGDPLGFYMLKSDELDQFFVARPARGTGAAATLLAHAEDDLARIGVDTAWLACAIGNDRAARFYEKHGWQRVGTMIHHAETSEGHFDVEVWRYEKRVKKIT